MRDKIMAMEAGRELDALIAAYIFGLSDITNVADYWFVEGNLKKLLHFYSTDISAAWEVFTKFEFPILEKGFDEDMNDYYVCKIGPHRVLADTAPLAICKAALLAVIKS